jgi:hypothetical protein
MEQEVYHEICMAVFGTDICMAVFGTNICMAVFGTDIKCLI